MLFDPLDHILGTRSKVRLLRALAPLDRPVSGREAARLAGLSRQAIGALNELASAGVIIRQEMAGHHLYTFSHSNRLAPALLSLFDEERARTEELFHRLRCTVGGTDAVLSAIIFGSAARGEAGPGSDLDLFVLVANIESRNSEYDRLVDASPALRSEFGVELSPVVLDVDRARRQYAEGDPFLAEVVRDGRRVYGQPIEELIVGQARP